MSPPQKPLYPFAYIILHYPKKSEQFIHREVAGLADRIGPLRVYSLEEPESAPPENPRIHVHNLARQPARRVIGAHLRLIIRRPGRYFQTMRKDVIGFYLRGTAPGKSPSKRRRTLRRTRLFLRCAVIADELLGSGTVHIHAHYAHHPAEAARRVSGFTGIPFSFTAHAKDLFLTKPRRLARLVRLSSFAVTCTRDGESTLRGLCRPRDRSKIFCRHHGLPLQRFRPPGNGAAKPYPPTILSVGRFIEKKGFDTLLQALARIKDGGRDFQSILAGDGRLSDDLRSRADRLGLNGRVRFPGFQTQAELVSLYREATIFALACRRLPDGNRDGIPNVVLEAMACGLPVVTTTVGGLSEAVRHGKNGFLVPPDHPDALAEALERLLDSPALGARMGRCGRETVSADFDIERSTRRLLRLFLRRAPRLARRIEEADASGGVDDDPSAPASAASERKPA